MRAARANRRARTVTLMLGTGDGDGLGAAAVEHGPLEIRMERRPRGRHALELLGELELSTVEAFEAELARVEASDAARIVVDLSQLEFIDSMGIRALLAAQARLGDAGRIEFTRGTPPVQRVLELTRADSALTFTD